ncbi:MAG: hypothetical protein N3G21_07425 [Candidatus Hydrogenedentes bacterium]|nr:hypothetical protein [Candidatus Hydrogenedentota bacterium]
MRKFALIIGIALTNLLFECSAHEPFVKSETELEHGAIIMSTENQGNYQIVTAKIPYLGIEGDEKIGLARLVIPINYLDKNGKLPAFCHVHYEKDINGAKKWAKRGWIVSTAVYTPPEGENPIDPAIGNGFNLAKAIIQWVKRLPIVDASHILIDGASQGGYMALAMSAELFPVIATHSDVPVVNWAYNISYFEANREIAGFGKPIEDAPLPGIAPVIGLADMCYKYFTNDLNDESWFYLSPISYTHLITNPVLITCATGDMLVPIEQMTKEFVRQFDASKFPNGFTRDFQKLNFCQKAKKVFEECLPEKDYEIFVIPPQPNSFEITREMLVNSKLKPKKRPSNQDKPWSKEKQWSLLYLDEGPPAPYSSHTKMEWSLSPDSFIEYYKSASIKPTLLSPPKLIYLLKRYQGIQEPEIKLKNQKIANRLNYSNIEKIDILISLITYLEQGKEHLNYLQTLYNQSPIKPFGEKILPNILREELRSLKISKTIY